MGLPSYGAAPQCGTFYIYTSLYEYLVYGSEDEESLRRISVEEAEKYMIE